MLVMVDDYSKYPEVEIVNTLSTNEVLQKLEKIMATHRVLIELRTDNGPPFHVQEMAA